MQWGESTRPLRSCTIPIHPHQPHQSCTKRIHQQVASYHGHVFPQRSPHQQQYRWISVFLVVRRNRRHSRGHSQLRAGSPFSKNWHQEHIQKRTNSSTMIDGSWVCSWMGRYILTPPFPSASDPLRRYFYILTPPFTSASDPPWRYLWPSQVLPNGSHASQVSNLLWVFSNHRGPGLIWVSWGSQNFNNNLHKNGTPFSNWKSGRAIDMSRLSGLQTWFPIYVGMPSSQQTLGAPSFAKVMGLQKKLCEGVGIFNWKVSTRSLGCANFSVKDSNSFT